MDDERQNARPSKVDWWSVGIFYALACAISWPVFWWRDQLPASWAAWQTPGFIKGLLPALGPALAAVVCAWLFRRTHRRKMTLPGTSPWRAVLFLVVPILVLAAYGVGDDEPHLTGLLWGGVLSAYALGEEYGWRGFLQDALRPLAPGVRFPLVGVLWGAWHFTTFLHGTPGEVGVRLSLMLAVWIGGSWGLGLLAERTASVLVAAAMHLVFNDLTLFPARTCLVILAPSVVVWALLLRGWPRPAGDRDMVEVRA